MKIQNITTNNVSSVSTFTSEQRAVGPQPSLLHRHRKAYPRIYLPYKNAENTQRNGAKPSQPYPANYPTAVFIGPVSSAVYVRSQTLARQRKRQPRLPRRKRKTQPPQQRGKKRGGKHARIQKVGAGCDILCRVLFDPLCRRFRSDTTDSFIGLCAFCFAMQDAWLGGCLCLRTQRCVVRCRNNSG